ncbi:VOC family protein [Phytoactinopolyspora endophytica]|uniref:VOC family protein n=1 Tax=Phytoactinopolyspora endophytica TaxID=1642495 RepID=UPI00197B52AA|nr:VOC family protein [Phytoactinopolyspora endophytica]
MDSTEHMAENPEGPTPEQATDAVRRLGWRYVHGALGTHVHVESLTQGADVVTRATAACGQDADDHLSADIRPRRVLLTLQSAKSASVTARDIELAGKISTAVADLGLLTGIGVGRGGSRSMQVVELVVEAVDVASVRPFWQAATGYDGEAGSRGSQDPLVDPLGQGPTIRFRQIDPSDARHRAIRVDVCVSRGEAERRRRALRELGATWVSEHPAGDCQVLADPAGNEVGVVALHGR